MSCSSVRFGGYRSRELTDEHTLRGIYTGGNKEEILKLDLKFHFSFTIFPCSTDSIESNSGIISREQ